MLFVSCELNDWKEAPLLLGTIKGVHNTFFIDKCLFDMRSEFSY